MGCDIHIFAEVKKNGKWEKVGNVFANPYYKKGHKNTIDEDGYEWNPKKIDSPYRGRNYDLFAILANVRNGRGFAGCDTGDGFVPIDTPRDLPEDVTAEIKAMSEDMGVDGHSHSYFTLKELNEYNWNQETKHRGFLDFEEYKAFKKSGSPQSWSSMVDGGGVVKISNSEMDKLLKSGRPDDKKQYYTKLEWGVKYKDAVGQFWFGKTIKALTKLAKNPEHIRIVFWFDN